VAEILASRAAELDTELPLPAEQLATMTFAMATGFAMERQLDPGAVPDELFGTMLEVFFAGVRQHAAATVA
jgi:hypothetical protein